MSQGTDRLLEWAMSLPAFADKGAAEAALFAKRDKQLDTLRSAAGSQSHFVYDESPESLKALEAWYFTLHEKGSFESTGVSRKEFEIAMHFYFCQVLSKHAPGMKWVVEENSIIPGKYSLGVGKPLFLYLVGDCSHLPLLRQNKRRQSMWRDFERYAR